MNDLSSLIFKKSIALLVTTIGFIGLAINSTEAQNINHSDPFAEGLMSGVPQQKLTEGELIALYEFGAESTAYLVLPEKAPKAGLLLVPNSMVNPDLVFARCDLLSKLGFLVLCVDLYNRNFNYERVTISDEQVVISEESIRKTIYAGMKLLCRSPRYQTPQLLIGAWGENLSHCLTIYQQMSRDKNFKPNLVGLSWLEPKMLKKIKEMGNLSFPLQFISPHTFKDNEKLTPEYLSLQNFFTTTQNSRPYPTLIESFNASPGFLFKEEANKQSLMAWASIIEFWSKVSENQSLELHGLAQNHTYTKKDNFTTAGATNTPSGQTAVSDATKAEIKPSEITPSPNPQNTTTNKKTSNSMNIKNKFRQNRAIPKR